MFFFAIFDCGAHFKSELRRLGLKYTWTTCEQVLLRLSLVWWALLKIITCRIQRRAGRIQYDTVVSDRPKILYAATTERLFGNGKGKEWEKPSQNPVGIGMDYTWKWDRKGMLIDCIGMRGNENVKSRSWSSLLSVSNLPKFMINLNLTRRKVPTDHNET